MNARTPAPDSPERFARRFRLLMSYHDLTLGDIAAATRSAVSTVGTWKNGRVPSSTRTLAKLAEIFHVRVEYLLAGRAPDREGGFSYATAANSKAGRRARPADELAARRLLDELECLLRALESSSHQTGNGHAEAVEEDASAEGVSYAKVPSLAKADAGKPASKGGRGGVRLVNAKALRRQVENYMQDYLDQAERAPGGLAHAWVQLRREFPLNLYEQLR